MSSISLLVPEATVGKRKVDYEGAVKVFDAIEGITSGGTKPRLILVSAVDIRDPEKIPAHYASFCFSSAL